MPGVLILEAMAQAGGYLALSYLEKEGEQAAYFMGIDKAKFRKPVVPGDNLRLEVKVLKQRGNIWVFKGEAYVGDTLVCEAELMAMMAGGEERK
jgi:3-hydroxymyristoyl/3-hydroxydecanoyl-(acyl carrier protein) dehydratase